jgi:hypothetical protein
MSRPRNIALADWNWRDHHPTFFCDFSEALLSLGWQVRLVSTIAQPPVEIEAAMFRGRVKVIELVGAALRSPGLS